MSNSSPEERMPPVGSACMDPNGFWKHQAHFLANRWAIVARWHVQDIETAREIETVRGAKAAARAFEQARITDCSEDEVIEVLQPVLGGWIIRDRAGHLDERNTLTSGDTPGVRMEKVWSQSGALIGVIRVVRPGEWHLRLRVSSPPEQGAVFRIPGKYADDVHESREAAIATAQRIVSDSEITGDDGWLEEWTTQFSRLQRAGVATSLTHSIEIVGASGTVCAAPDCDTEAGVRLTRSGPDVIKASRLVCQHHSALILAHHTPEAGPPTS